MPRAKSSRTTKPQAEDKEVALPLGGEVSTDVLDFLGGEAKDESARILSTGGDWISTQGGNFSYQGDVLDPELDVVVVDFAYDYAYYEGQFDPDNPESPQCFALARNPSELQPHPEARNQQGDDDGMCKMCPKNAFGSRGRGKACKNSIRLALLTLDSIQSGDFKVYQLRISPTGIRPFSQYTKKINGAMNRPLWSVATRFTMEQQKTYSLPVPGLLGTINDKETLEKLKAFRETLGDMIIDPGSYLIDRSVEEQANGRKPRGKLK